MCELNIIKEKLQELYREKGLTLSKARELLAPFGAQFPSQLKKEDYLTVMEILNTYQ